MTTRSTVLAENQISGRKLLALLEAEMAQMPPCEYKLVRRITPGLYSREWSAKAGVKCTTRVHKTEHQFVISKGKVRIWTEDYGWLVFQAPYHGITKPGTKRVLDIIEDLVFTTFHATDKTNMEEIDAELVEPDERIDALAAEQSERFLK